MYKYNCRKCPIRNRCISESDNSPSVKQMLKAAFEARTDTLKVWDRLQRNCLLVKAEEERAKKISTGSLLSRRLREARESKEEASRAAKQRPDYLRPVSDASGSPKLKSLPSSSRPKLRQLSSSSTKSGSETASASVQVEFNPPASPEAQSAAESSPKWLSSPNQSISMDERPEMIGDTGPVTPPSPSPPVRERSQKPEARRPHWFTIGSNERHITLPVNGEIVLGRFDPRIGIPPDIDLSYEDRQANSVSRRHAKIVGANGRHTIEDLGSRHGVLINGKRIESGLPRQLKTGDRVNLGQTLLLYDAVPTHLLTISPTNHVRHIIVVTPTGRRVPIAPPNEIIIGRSDAYVDFKPGIDLGKEGEVSARVSRRHAIISWRSGLPYVEDSGSGFGTRLNGEMLLMGQAVQLKPGDHIWLGGCVLAYDVAW
ncbi:MAG: FHA domain-containing protein [Anaerolineae bacterium]|nr:FHA domain-containing protein [Anaerolineae bacterium]